MALSVSSASAVWCDLIANRSCSYNGSASVCPSDSVRLQDLKCSGDLKTYVIDIPQSQPSYCGSSARPRLHLIRFHGVLAPNAQHCHLMTLSARYTTDCGIVRPICLAVLRLITNSNFVGCSTGRSAGLASFSILSTNAAARRNNSSSFAACCASFAYSF